MSIGAYTDDPLGSFIFRTTGFNSIRTLAARLHYFKAVSGDRLACLPLELRLRGKSTRQSHGATIYFVDITIAVGMSLEEALAEARQTDEERRLPGLTRRRWMRRPGWDSAMARSRTARTMAERWSRSSFRKVRERVPMRRVEIPMRRPTRSVQDRRASHRWRRSWRSGRLRWIGRWRRVAWCCAAFVGLAGAAETTGLVRAL